jgi:hypothetical protein
MEFMILSSSKIEFFQQAACSTIASANRVRIVWASLIHALSASQDVFIARDLKTFLQTPAGIYQRSK